MGAPRTICTKLELPQVTSLESALEQKITSLTMKTNLSQWSYSRSTGNDQTSADAPHLCWRLIQLWLFFFLKKSFLSVEIKRQGISINSYTDQPERIHYCCEGIHPERGREDREYTTEGEGMCRIQMIPRQRHTSWWRAKARK